MVGAPLVKGLEAEKAGIIKYGDIIVAVNGDKTEGRPAFEIIDQIGENPNADTITKSYLEYQGHVMLFGLLSLRHDLYKFYANIISKAL